MTALVQQVRHNGRDMAGDERSFVGERSCPT